MARIKKNKKFGAIGKKPPREIVVPLFKIQAQPDKVRKPKKPKALKFR